MAPILTAHAPMSVLLDNIVIKNDHVAMLHPLTTLATITYLQNSVEQGTASVQHIVPTTARRWTLNPTTVIDPNVYCILYQPVRIISTC